MGLPGLVIGISGDVSGLTKSLGGASGKVSAFGKSMDVSTLAMGAGVAGAAVIAGKALWDMAEGAAADRAEQEKLAAAIAAATGSTEDHTAAIDAAIAAGQDKAFTDSETRDALQSLVTSTGDLTAATALLGPAQDIARLAGVDLATASDAIAKAQGGQDGALRKLIPGLAKGATTADTLAAATAAAAGQADIYAKSGPGMAAKTSDAMGELGETLGSALLPVMDALMPALVEIVKALGKLLTAILPAIIPLFKLLGAAIKIVADAVVKVLDFIGSLITQLKSAMDLVGGLLSKIPKIPGLPSFGSVTPGAAGASTYATSAGASGGFVVNVYGGDPAQVQAAVVRALRGYTARNGAAGLSGMGIDR